MVPFVIVADLRTGSTLLSSSLDEHPQVRCRGELLHTENLPDNQLNGFERAEASGRDVVGRAFAEKGVAAAGFRAMVFLPLPDRPQWVDLWQALGETGGLHVIYLPRRDKLAQYASVVVASRLRVWHPSPGDAVLRPENRPRIAIDPAEFRRWTAEREALFALRREQLAGKPSLELDYETLTGDWPGTIERVETFLGIELVALEPSKRKQERRPLREVIANYDELVS